MAVSIGHINICVEDLEASISFYEKAFGLKVIHVIDNDTRHVVWMADDGGTGIPDFIELRQNKGHEGPYEHGEEANHYSLTVPDRDAALALHQSMGIVKEIGPSGGYHIRDNSGYDVEVISEDIIRKMLKR